MLRIRLFPKGKKHQRTFRIVIAERRKKANGKFIKDLGFYTPQTKILKINKEEMNQWIKKGAQVSKGVDKLLNPKKYPVKKKTTTPKPTETKTETKKT
ncbi:30S ribosomal protein S16 [Patescibacteria group bacterium]|nr:30S ribosomal protein S16 [Pseudomonadota bacterium]MBU1129761.1 30S ribosomal protein S16 [Patescibacteria group bacterium]